MKDKKVLIISSEVVPYLPNTEQAFNSFQIPKYVNEKGGQTRIFMPRYGLINERRHQLHEVIRLSGMNLVINELDTPLIIKVASIPKERMQVYFIDNEDFFKRRAILRDDKGNLFEDNDDRMVFFTKGVIETVKKLNWSPDIIHLHGWFTSLFPLYLKTLYKDEPLFQDSKLVTSIYPKDFDGSMSDTLKTKVASDKIEDKSIEALAEASYENLIKINVDHADGFVIASDEVDDHTVAAIKSSKKPLLEYQATTEEDAYTNFYTEQIC
ncbi:MAG: glycogen/starch synthase [Flavobacteriaceae bacterium]